MSLPIVLVPHPHVRIEATVLAGSPYVEGSRVLVRRLFGFYQDGVPVETLLRRFPNLSPAQIFDALAFAFDNLEVMDADRAREREMLRRVNQRPATRSRSSPEQIELPFGAPRAAVVSQASARRARAR